jgi:hypothetical protein
VALDDSVPRDHAGVDQAEERIDGGLVGQALLRGEAGSEPGLCAHRVLSLLRLVAIDVEAHRGHAPRGHLLDLAFGSHVNLPHRCNSLVTGGQVQGMGQSVESREDDFPR